MSSSLLQCDLDTLYFVIDDAIKELGVKQSKVGRPSRLTDSELITILVYNTLFLRQRNLKDILKFIDKYHHSDFPTLPKYSTFIEHVHRALPLMTYVLSLTLARSEINFADSTMLEVCRLFRVDSHKVARNVANLGKNYQGWHYGFKLHACVNKQGLFSSLAFSPANVYDAQMLPKLAKEFMKIIVGDSHYGAKVMRENIWKKYKIVIIAPPHHTQKSKVITLWQNLLLGMRSKIESVFDILKQHFPLVSSFPRSVKGYFVHYVRVLLAYQFSMLLKLVKIS